MLNGRPAPAAAGAPARQRARAFCFTWNNPDGVPTLATFGGRAKYLCYGHEVGENGTPHLQGYVQFATPVDFSSVLRMLPEAHFEIARGSPEANIAYCSKDGIFEEEGERPAQGKRSDLAELAQAVMERTPVRTVATMFPSSFIRYHRGITALTRVISEPRNFPPEIILIVGPTRTGKSRAAFELSGTHLENGVSVVNDVYWKPPGEWWDDYDGQHTVVWDEFTGASYPFRSLLRVLDRYPLLVPVKGNFVQFRSRRVVITSNIDPREWYNYADLGQPEWEQNPLHARFREFGRVLYTGEAHRVVRQRLDDEVAAADAEHQRWVNFFANFVPREGPE